VLAHLKTLFCPNGFKKFYFNPIKTISFAPCLSNTSHMAQFHSLKVKQVKRETAEAVSITFDIPSNLQSAYHYIQGQYLTLKISIKGEEVRRSYSVCSSPYLKEDLRVAVKAVQGGKMSTYLNETLKEGDTIDVMTPMGQFYSKLDGSQSNHYVLFAGGSGITPMLSHIKSIKQQEPNSKVSLVYANKNIESTIFHQELNSLVSDHVTRIDILEEGANDAFYSGMLTKEKCRQIIDKHILLKSADHVFICGPGPMMENVKSVLETLSYPKDRMHIEYFSAVIDDIKKAESVSNVTAENVTAAVTVMQYGIETTFNLNTKGLSILDAAVEAGVDAPFSCKGAVCCTCRGKVIEGQVKMDANFALTDQEVNEGFVLTCQAHPITSKVVIDYDA
jgi:ring-1,2-phenylacetyl-CoA epoxidase subunit PaaE